MAEIRKSSASLPSQLTVLEGGQSVGRPSSGGSVKRTVKGMPSEGLIALPPEPAAVQFEETAMRPGSGGSSSSSRAGSAGRIEKKLQLARKQELSQEEPRRSSAGGRLSSNSHTHTTEPLSVRKLHLADGAKKKPIQGPSVNKENKTEQDSEEDSSETSNDSESSSEEEAEAGAGASQASNTGAPVELKGEFLKCIMDEDYTKAQELCKQILLLEPDNATCSEFHSVIHEKIKQDEEQEEDDDDDDEDSEDDDEESSDSEDEGDDEDKESDDDDDDDDDDDSEDESDSDDDASLPQGPINLLVGGLPVRLEPR